MNETRRQFIVSSLKTFDLTVLILTFVLSMILSACLLYTSNKNLWLLSCGSLAVDSANLLNSERIKTRFQELRDEFDYVIIDAPPMSRYADAMALGKLADGFVLVLEANSTRREAAMRVTESLSQAQIRVLGAVLNKRTFPIPESLYRRF